MTAALESRLASIAAHHSPAVLASSMQAEAMVLTDVIARARLPIGIFILDTGRLHAETLELVDVIKERYRIAVDVHRPREMAVRAYIQVYGRDAFYRSFELRRACCDMRKVEPLKRALAGKRAWITGRRREQSNGRSQLAEREFDLSHGLVKFNPLAGWSEAQVWDYIAEHAVPYNRLYDQGYRSIGCAPCTRPTLPDEPPRAGRWWWEAAEHKECGLHERALA